MQIRFLGDGQIVSQEHSKIRLRRRALEARVAMAPAVGRADPALIRERGSDRRLRCVKRPGGLHARRTATCRRNSNAWPPGHETGGDGRGPHHADHRLPHAQDRPKLARTRRRLSGADQPGSASEVLRETSTKTWVEGHTGTGNRSGLRIIFEGVRKLLSQTKFGPIDVNESLTGLELSLQRALTA